MRQINRWFYVAGGTVSLMFAGLVYAWSVFSVPIAEEFKDWSRTQLSTTFTIVMAFFCLGSFVGGLAAKRYDAKNNVRIAGVLFLVGFLLTSRTNNMAMLYIGFGVLGGTGAGLVYNGVMGKIIRWFPDGQGLTSGIMLMGFGVGSFILGKVYAAAVTAGSYSWRDFFSGACRRHVRRLFPGKLFHAVADRCQHVWESREKRDTRRRWR
ncbi:MAG: MFS transporter [Planctomycetaceae bacterium]|nr:MFS transporter [Planctomycetaceae bacterium]